MCLINKWTKTICIAVTYLFARAGLRACVRTCVLACARDFIQLSGLLVYLPCIVWSLS